MCVCVLRRILVFKKRIGNDWTLRWKSVEFFVEAVIESTMLKVIKWRGRELQKKELK